VSLASGEEFAVASGNLRRLSYLEMA